MAARGPVKTMVPRACSTLDDHSEVKQRRATQGSCFYKSQFSSLDPSWLTTKKLGLVNFSHTTHRAPLIALSIQCWLRVMVSLSLLILRRYLPGECRKIFLTLMPAAPVHIGRGFHCIAYLVHIFY